MLVSSSSIAHAAAELLNGRDLVCHNLFAGLLHAADGHVPSQRVSVALLDEPQWGRVSTHPDAHEFIKVLSGPGAHWSLYANYEKVIQIYAMWREEGRLRLRPQHPVLNPDTLRTTWTRRVAPGQHVRFRAFGATGLLAHEDRQAGLPDVLHFML